MAFTSLSFLLFLALVATAYLLLPHRARTVLLVVANLAFYAFYVWWAPLFMAGFSLAVYLAARQIHKAKSRKLFRLLTVIGLALVLFFLLRYSGLVNDFLAFLTLPGGGRIRIVFPLGFSYYLFKSLGYLIDVYRQRLEPESRYFHLLLYVSYFPEISLGPITPAADFLPQIDQVKPFDSKALSAGFFLIVWGFFKKLVFADRLAILIAPFYRDVAGLGSGVGWLAISFAYFIQLYLDFSGYTDISVGISRILGFRVQENFNAPLIADSMSEYWRRWHMSLYVWFSEYIFKPLQFSWRRLNRYASALAAFVTLTVSGIWHEARPGFMIWGVLMGLFVAFDAIFAKKRKQLKKKMPTWLFMGMGIGLTLLINTLVLAFTRAQSAKDAFYILSRIFSLSSGSSGLPSGFGRALILGLMATMVSHLLEWRRPSLESGLSRMPLLVRWGFLQLMLFSVILFASQSADLVGGFIYARF